MNTCWNHQPPQQPQTPPQTLMQSQCPMYNTQNLLNQFLHILVNTLKKDPEVHTPNTQPQNPNTTHVSNLYPNNHVDAKLPSKKDQIWAQWLQYCN